MSPEELLAKLPGGDEFATGKKVYANLDCANCHRLGETGGGGMGGMKGGPGGEKGGPPGGRGGLGGPILTNVGAKEEHTVQWLSEHIRDAKSHKPQSRMPAYGPDKISDTDLKVLAEYLAGRK